VVRVARDPNAKYGLEGNVSAGQWLDYRLEFENEGAGIAYGVYFTDVLSEYLNASSLQIGSVYSTADDTLMGAPGTYDTGTRTITWFVGELGPKKGGYANISIKVADDVPLGSEILNYGTVYFPSVPEVTPTNGVVSTVIQNQGPIAAAGSNLVVKTYEDILFDGSGSTDPDGIIVDYTWDFGDGEQGYGKKVTHSYFDDGKYKVKLMVTDDRDKSDTHEITVTVQNRLPSAVLEVDLTEVFTNTEVTFTTDQSTDIDGTVVNYYLDFGDGTNSGWVSTSTIKHIYTDGTKVYTAKLSVKDDDGAVSTNIAELEITVNNRLPVASLSADKMEAFTYEDIIFNAGQSTDSDGTISGYYFDFGDDTNSGWLTSSMITHQYTDGTNDYDVTLTVKDDDGTVNVREIVITINNRAPIAVCGEDRTVETNEALDFSAESSTDQDGVIKSYSWDFGDGITYNGKTTMHTYEDDGEYTVTLTVMDDDGAIDVDKSVITVNNVKPIAGFSVNPIEGDVTTEFAFSSTSTDTDGTVISYAWDFGDGHSSTDANPTHQYESVGTYMVSLLVYDDDGVASDKYELEIVINNLAPVAAATQSMETAFVGDSITFDASGSYDIDGRVNKFNWQFGDDTIGSGKVVEHSYDSSGKYTITLKVTDDLGKTGKTTLKITIEEKMPDFDSDGIPDDVDPDDDNDGMTDVWEDEFGLNKFYSADADLDTDDDKLTNVEEFELNTDPNNPDTDGDGFSDFDDPYPTDPTRPKRESDSIEDGSNLQTYLILAIVIILIILIIISMVIRKRKQGQSGASYAHDPELQEVRDEVLKDSREQNLSISRQGIKSKLESSQAQAELSEETYKYINEQILHEDVEAEE
jgi:PKD repeat protein